LRPPEPQYPRVYHGFAEVLTMGDRAQIGKFYCRLDNANHLHCMASVDLFGVHCQSIRGDMQKFIIGLIVGILVGAANPEAVINLRNTIVRSSIAQLKQFDDAQRNQTTGNRSRNNYRDR
jgi:hypothetical protein